MAGINIDTRVSQTGQNTFATPDYAGLGQSIGGIFTAFQNKKKQERLQPFQDQQLAAQKTASELAQRNDFNDIQKLDTVSLGDFADTFLPSIEQAKASGDFTKVNQLISQRKNLLLSQNRDISQTQEIQDVIASGDLEGLDEVQSSLGAIQEARDKINSGTAGQGEVLKTTEGKVKNEDGTFTHGQNVFTKDKAGNITSKFVPASGGFVPTTKGGASFSEQAQLAADKKAAQLKAEADNVARVEEQKGIGRDTAKDLGTAITSGAESSFQIDGFDKTLELLDIVETGGTFNEVKLFAKQKLGIESANEGELNNSLSQAFLQQLKPIFGAQFTAAEGKLLKDIEANYGKSNATNRKLVQRAQDAVIKKSVQGARAAITASRTDKLEEISLNMGISVEDLTKMTKLKTKSIAPRYKKIRQANTALEQQQAQPAVNLDTVTSTDLQNLTDEQLQQLLNQG